MRLIFRPVLLLLVVAAALLGAPALVAGHGTISAHADVDVIGDDGKDMFVGSGALLLPGSMYSDGRGQAATCSGCQWKAVLECDLTTASSCRGPARLCGVDGAWLRIWMAPPGGAWQDFGAACFGSGGPVRRDVAEAEIRDLIWRSVPPLRPAAQPSSGVLTQLPVVFTTGQTAGPQSSEHVILGLPLELTIVPSWAWDFGDGAGLTTHRAGTPWPDAEVSHRYDRAGTADARVVARWKASYVVSGIGPLEVAEPVTQEAQVTVPVGEGRAVLVR